MADIGSKCCQYEVVKYFTADIGSKPCHYEVYSKVQWDLKLIRHAWCGLLFRYPASHGKYRLGLSQSDRLL